MKTISLSFFPPVIVVLGMLMVSISGVLAGISFSSNYNGPAVFDSSNSSKVPNGSLVRVGYVENPVEPTSSFVEIGTSTIKNAGFGPQAIPGKLAGSVVLNWGADYPNFSGRQIYVWVGNSATWASASQQGLYRTNLTFPASSDTNLIIEPAINFVASHAIPGLGTGTIVVGDATDLLHIVLASPLPESGGLSASLISTTAVRVEGWVNARDAATAVTVDYGTDGISFISVPASPSLVSGQTNTPVFANLQGLVQGTTYYCRIKGVSAGGTGVSTVRTFTLNVLSGLLQTFPPPPPGALGSVQVHLTPPGTGGWRFTGEQEWRAPSATATALTSGDRIVEFRPVTGYNQPPQEIVSVMSGEPPLVLSGTYYASPVAGSGTLSVVLKPDALAAQGGWRLAGESAWRASGTTAEALAAGTWLVECKPVSGRTTPPPADVEVASGPPALLTLTYFQTGAAAGVTPSVLDFVTVSSNQEMPYAYTGQLRSRHGSGSGFVVKPRVVVTAAHMLWDDGTLSAAEGVQWLFQRDRGSYEPRPQIPRGFYMLGSYAAQRLADNSPGTSSPQSQNLDFAALYFGEDAGRGGACGFLASDAMANEFLLSSAQKVLAGYPVDGFAALQAGKMHATAPANILFTPAFGRTYTTTGLSSSGGNSGGPLFVQHTSGKYYPAAIYLGGSAQTVVRAIDSAVVDIISRAEVSANGGPNNTGGGITHTSVTGFGTSGQPGALVVHLEPLSAHMAGAGWRLTPETSNRTSGSQKSGLSAGVYTLELAIAAGFQTPAPQSVTISGGQITTLTFTYASSPSSLEAWRQDHFGGSAANAGVAADEADPDGDGWNNLQEYTAATDPNSAADRLTILSTTRGTEGFTLSFTAKAGRRYELQRNTAPDSPVAWSPIVTASVRSTAGTETLTDQSPPDGKAVYRVKVSLP